MRKWFRRNLVSLYDIFNCNWVEPRWTVHMYTQTVHIYKQTVHSTVHIYTQTVHTIQQYSTHLHTNGTHNTAVQYTFTHKHYTFTHTQYTEQHNEKEYPEQNIHNLTFLETGLGKLL
jgi:hypothetical protein